MLSFLVLILTNGSFFPVSILLSDDMVGSLKNPNQKKQSLIRFTRVSIQVNQCVRSVFYPEKMLQDNNKEKKAAVECHSFPFVFKWWRQNALSQSLLCSATTALCISYRSVTVSICACRKKCYDSFINQKWFYSF